ncbi:MAG: hypothetical protein PHS04_07950 [Tissierellia bacterium]|nr:hypothetical protein [Tissierellia bacterium]
MEREELIKLIMKRIYTRRIYAEGLADDILRLFDVSSTCIVCGCGCDWIDIDYKVRKCIKCGKTEQLD